MSTTYSVIRTIEDATSNTTDVAVVYFGVAPKMNRWDVESVASKLANEFKVENNQRRIEFDCIETNENGERTVFKNINIQNDKFGVVSKKTMQNIIDEINKSSRQ